MPMIPRNWRKLSVKEIEGYKDRVCKQGVIYIQGNKDREPYRCSYCDDTEVLYRGSVHIGGGVGSFFYLACEKCKRKGERAYKRAKLPLPSIELSSRFGNYMSGSGAMKGGLSSNGRGLST